MHVGELLYQVDKHGVTLRCGWAENRLHYTPAGVLPQDLVGLAVIVLLPFGERVVLTKQPPAMCVLLPLYGNSVVKGS